jgi:hypothetical protein
MSGKSSDYDLADAIVQKSNLADATKSLKMKRDPGFVIIPALVKTRAKGASAEASTNLVGRNRPSYPQN